MSVRALCYHSRLHHAICMLCMLQTYMRCLLQLHWLLLLLPLSWHCSGGLLLLLLMTLLLLLCLFARCMQELNEQMLKAWNLVHTREVVDINHVVQALLARGLTLRANQVKVKELQAESLPQHAGQLVCHPLWGAVQKALWVAAAGAAGGAGHGRACRLAGYSGQLLHTCPPRLPAQVVVTQRGALADHRCAPQNIDLVQHTAMLHKLLHNHRWFEFC
mmetsp:Transcript_10669/g.22931  ORF Transcript_10669/g.22931 Transcript_10669/m.22931 type:complete len:218 (-) Transcript_10669:874-1527(-)